MITKEQKNKKCLFCVSDYHLEMILLPYIIDNKDKYINIVFTETNLENSIDILLTKVNFKKEDKEIIEMMNWNCDDDLKFNQIEKSEEKNFNIIINGSLNYINLITKKLEEITNKYIEIVHCFHIGDLDVDITEISKKYNVILNTKKLQ